jgi:hypothetical protein
VQLLDDGLVVFNKPSSSFLKEWNYLHHAANSFANANVAISTANLQLFVSFLFSLFFIPFFLFVL